MKIKLNLRQFFHVRKSRGFIAEQRRIALHQKPDFEKSVRGCLYYCTYTRNTVINQREFAKLEAITTALRDISVRGDRRRTSNCS